MSDSSHEKNGFRKEKVLIISSSVVPDEIWRKVRESSNGESCIHYISEFSPGVGEDHWGNHLSMENIEKYWKDQCERTNYKGTLIQFIKSYGLEVDKWLVETGYDFTGIEKIFFEE